MTSHASPPPGSDPAPQPGSSNPPPNLIWAAIPLGLGILVITVLMLLRQPPSERPDTEATTPVRTVEVSRGTVLPRTLGFGFVVPSRQWSAISEVSGRVVERHPDLEPGNLIPGNTKIIQIDPVDYELEVTRLEANIRATEASLAELNQKEENTKASLAIEERALALSEKDLDRQRNLLSRGTVSQAAVDSQERSVLTQRQNVQTRRNDLNLIPAQRALREAELELAQVQLAEARRDLDRTVITLPFSARIQSVAVEPDQVVSAGQTMVEADGLDQVEITAQVPLEQLAPLFAARSEDRFGPSQLFARGQGTTPVFEDLGFTALVRLSGDTIDAAWEAEVVRLAEQVDPQTRTIGVVVAVDDPLGSTRPGRRPPLTRNMYVAVELRGAALENAIAIPRTAVHGANGRSRVYVAGPDDRLEVRPVTIQFLQAGIAILETGIEAGDRIIVSDLIPAVPGMKLDIQDDPDAAARLAAEMSGEAPIR